MDPSSGTSFSSAAFLVGVLASATMVFCACGQTQTSLEERIAIAREQRNEAEIVRLVTEYEDRLKRGESKPEVFDALYRLGSTALSWEWKDFQKQIEIPTRIAMLALEKNTSQAPLEAQIYFVMVLSEPPHPRDPKLAKLLAQRKHRLDLMLPVLHRLTARIDPTIDVMDIRTFSHVQPPPGATSPSGLPAVGPAEIKDPALRAEYERRIRERELMEQRKGEKMRLLLLKKGLLQHLENYIVAVYTLGPPDQQEFQEVLNSLGGDGKDAELQATTARIITKVEAAATRPS